jgi:hypothetical protein
MNIALYVFNYLGDVPMLYSLRQYDGRTSGNPLQFYQLILNNAFVQTHFSSLSVFITLIVYLNTFSLNLADTGLFLES